MGPSRNPTFTRPPITEIGVGITFQRPNFLKTAHLGRFWERVAKDLPITEDHTPSGLPSDWATSVEGMPLPRLWLCQADGAAILQLQLTRFDFNWRRQSQDTQYPYFAEHAKRFMHYWTNFAAFANGESRDPLVIRSAEVVKVSQIREGDGWNTLADIENMFPSFKFSVFGDDWQIGGLACGLEMVSQEGKVRAEIKSAALALEAGRKIMHIEIKAEAAAVNATSADFGDLEGRLKVANELANLAFTSLTSPTVQKDAWGRSR